MVTPARLAAAIDAYAPSFRFAMRSRPSGPVKRSIAVVRANVSHDANTESVETRVTPLRFIVAQMSSSSSMPCSMESTAASAATPAPSR